MKRFTQAVLPIVILVGLVGGVTFIAQYNGRTPAPAPSAVATAQKEPLPFQRTRVEWDEDDPDYVAEWALNEPGYADFAFENGAGEEIEVGLQYQSCTCATVQVAVLDAASWRRFEERAGLTGLEGLTVAGGQPGLLGTLAAAELASQLRWQTLEVGGPYTTIPAAGADGEPVRGWVRLGWRAQKLGKERLAVELDRRLRSDGSRWPKRLEAPVAFVPVVRVYPGRWELGAWNIAQPPPLVPLWCWSAAQDDFTLTAAGVPGLHFACQRLSPEECGDLEQTLRDAEIVTRVRSAYRVRVERPTGNRPSLDLGPLEGTAVLTTAAQAEPLRVPLAGLVRGEVTVSGGEEADRISLGSFAASRGTRRAVTLTAARPDLGLRVESRSPDYLVVGLEEMPPLGGQKRWQLSVDVPPDRALGPLPAGSAVYLHVGGDPPRRLCLPVTGQAFR